MLDHDGELLGRRQIGSTVQNLRWQPGTQGDQGSKTLWLVQPEVIGHDSTLTKAKDNELVWITGVARQRGIEKSLHGLVRGLHGCHIGRTTTCTGKPGVPYGPRWPQRYLQRPLGTQHYAAATAQVRRQPKQIKRIRPRPWRARMVGCGPSPCGSKIA